MDERGMLYGDDEATCVAALGGFLEGVSFLNRDRRANFAEAFILKGAEDSDVLAELASAFSHIPDLELRFGKAFEDGFRGFEHEIASRLLVDPHLRDEKAAANMRGYLGFKIMDRMVDVIDWDVPPKLVFGTSRKLGGRMTFFLLRTPTAGLALYFHSAEPGFPPE